MRIVGINISVSMLASLCLLLISSPIIFAADSPTTLSSIIEDSNVVSTTERSLKCSERSSSCDKCVKSFSCYYCDKTKTCYDYNPLDAFKECSHSSSDSFYKTCKFKANVLVIVLGSLLGVLALIILIGLLYCCVIRPCVQRCYERDENRWQRDRLVMEKLQRERRRERNNNLDNIRAKYGIQPRGQGNDERF